MNMKLFYLKCLTLKHGMHLEPAYNKATITWTMIYVAVYLRVCLDCLHFLKPVWIYSVCTFHTQYLTVTVFAKPFHRELKTH